MKILIDARPLQTYSRFRGIGRYVNEIIGVFKDNPDVHFLFFKGADIDIRPKNKILINTPRRGITFTDRYFLKRILKKNRITIFHSTAFSLPEKTAGTRFVLTIHDLTPILFPEYSSAKNSFIFSKVLNSAERADKIIAVSKNTKKDLMRIRDISSSRIKVIYSPVNITGSGEISEKINSPKLPPEFVLYAGGFDGNKNVETIIKAFNIFKKPLVMTGMISSEHKMKLTSIANTDLRKMIHFTGYVSDRELASIYRRAKLFLFPSIYEGFGFPPLEALKFGTPSVVSNSGSLKEVLKDAALFLENPMNEEELAEKAILLWEDDPGRKALVERGERIIKQYSTSNFKNELFELYDSLHSGEV